MFKKPVEAKLSQRLSGADKKKLRRTAKERFPQASDADIDEILPTKAEITVAKYTNRVHVYSIEGGIPMLFDIDGQGTEIYPTAIDRSVASYKRARAARDSDGHFFNSSYHISIYPQLIMLGVDPPTMTATDLLLLFVSLGSIADVHCDTELCLGTGAASSSRAGDQKAAAAGKAPPQQQQQKEQQITIFYDGQICVCDVTEIQAKAIISTARREIEDTDQAKKNQSDESSLPPPLQPSQPQLLNRSLSMKRSLQRFLQNRKTRAHESAPNNHQQDVL
ncbi:hypothetical protein Cni_G12125 [Canna indica]|uniref:Tify domain-containing protein n=1 Tax=Canna indica TaxID=4628 RepID=A0AAQ3QCE6_9LILI|nr:hypothetical protein Cni_G12125 [Canna indica]